MSPERRLGVGLLVSLAVNGLALMLVARLWHPAPVWQHASPLRVTRIDAPPRPALPPPPPKPAPPRPHPTKPPPPKPHPRPGTRRKVSQPAPPAPSGGSDAGTPAPAPAPPPPRHLLTTRRPDARPAVSAPDPAPVTADEPSPAPPVTHPVNSTKQPVSHLPSLPASAFRLPDGSGLGGTQGAGSGKGAGEGTGAGSGSGAGDKATSGPFGVGAGPAGDGAPRHIVYVLDLSGSMSSRIDRAEAELRAALQTLRLGETFNIVVFSEDARAFDTAMAPVTPQTLHQADAFLDTLRVGGGTNLEAAMVRALTRPGVNEIVILTDGVPTEGETNFRRLAREIRQLNSQHARISAVGLVGRNPDGTDDTFEATNLLQQIARDSGGVSKLVTVGSAMP